MLSAISSNAHTGTPNLQVSDARGLAARAVQFHQREVRDPIEARVTEQRFDAVGRLLACRDAYLFELAKTDQLTPFNLTQVTSLSGVTLLTDSVDAGWRLLLAGGAEQVVERWDGRGSHSLTEYDDLLRPLAVRESGQDIAPHTLERFTYAGVDGIAHNLCGQLIRHDDPAGTVDVHDLNIAGAVLKHTRRFLLHTDPPDWPKLAADRNALLETADGATTSYRFSPVSELLQQTDALLNRQAFAYTVAGQLKETRLTLAGESQVEKLLVGDIYYSVTGQIEAETAGNGVITRHCYDEANGRLTELSAHKANGTPLQVLNYQCDAVGNVLSIEDAAQPIRYFNNQHIEPIKTYRYDSLYQLIEATGYEAKSGQSGPALPDFQTLPTDPSQIANYTQTYHYDAGGNLLELVHLGAQAHGPTLTRARYSNRCLPERDNRPPTEEELAKGFDANGNMRELQAGQPLSWDLRNQLSAVQLIVRKTAEADRECYVYDGGGQRVRKVHVSQANARTLTREVRYLPGLEIRINSKPDETLHVITVSAGSNNVQVLHWVAERPSEVPQDQVRYSLNDHLKSSALELDQNADLISQEWYYPFGCTAYWAGRNAIEAKYKTVRYSGKERDATGLYYYGFRYYAPWLQRWINPDPAGLVDGINLYVMVNNNPIVFIDLNGLAGDGALPGQNRANAAATTMLSQGSSWGRWRETNVLQLHQTGGLKALATISEKNITRLRVLELTETEQKFLADFIVQPVTLVHFTEKNIEIENNHIKFRSRKELQSKGIEFTEWHTTEQDIEDLASDDYIFFSLSIGPPSKIKSAFGQFRYALTIATANESKHGRFGLATANDLLSYERRQTRNFPAYFDELDEFKIKRQHIADDPTELLFSQDHMMEGLGRMILRDMRATKLSSNAINQILTSKTPEEFDQVLRTFYRPQLLFPKKISAPVASIEKSFIKHSFHRGLPQFN